MKENNIIPQKIENENRKFILFEINNIKYAIDASYVVELMHIPKFETPNKMSKYIAGVMPYDPVSINIIDIRPILNIKIEKYKLNDSLIILKTSENIFGIIVNKIIDIITLDNSNIQLLPFDSANKLIEFLYYYQKSNVSIINPYIIDDIVKNSKNEQNEQNNINLFPLDENSDKILNKRQHNLYIKSKRIFETIIEKENFLQFQTDNLNFALNIKYIKEIVKLSQNKSIEIPQVPKYINKIVNVRGDYINALSLSIFLNNTVNDNVNEKYKNLIILDIKHLKIGILAHEIFNIHSLKPEEFVLNIDSKFHTGYITGDIFNNNKLFSILNIEKIINDEKLYITQK